MAVIASRIMVVEDDAELRSLLARGLAEEGFEVLGVSDGSGALRRFDDRFDALVIDVGLPDADGRDVCHALRARGSTVPVLFLTAADAVTDRLAGFGAGGDDYLTKPVPFDELVARLRALVRRAGADPSPAVPGLRLDPLRYTIATTDAEVSLTPTEFRVLATLAATPEAIVRRRELVRAAWPEGAIVHDNTLDQYIARLRRKLRQASSEREIVTAHGVGYRLA
jgi:DNA-binding response OmpR family regulator